jgi:subtilisin family serine protease
MRKETLRPPSVTDPCEERDKTHGGVGGRSTSQNSAASFFRQRPLSLYPAKVVGRGCSKPQQVPPPRHGRRPLLILIAAALASPLFGAIPAHADLCIAVDPLLSVGCDRHETASVPRTSAGQVAPSQGEVVPLSGTTTEYDPRRIAVTVDRRATPRQIAAAFAHAGVQVEQAVRQIDAYLVLVDPERQAAAVRALRSSPVVARAGPEVVAHALDTTPNDSEWPAQAGLRVVGLPRAWDTSRGSAALVVAIVDTGVDANQPDLRGAFVPGVNLIDPAAPPRDDHGHGTAVAGVVAARANNGQGMAGVCWFCLIMPVKVLDSSGSGDDTRIAAGIVWAADHGARVINLSLGGPGDTPELEAALAYAAHKGAIAVAAAGNSGTTIPFYPAADVNALSVAATTTTDRAYSWSNFGSWVDVAAPGCNVAPALTRGYGLFCGTSSATPIVSGLAALALSSNAAATPAEIASAIERSSAPLPGVVQFGRVDAPRALALLEATARRTEVRRGKLTSTRSGRSYEVQSAPGSFRATVRFRQGSVVTVTLESAETGARLAQKTGRSPLRLSEPVLGPVKIVVRAVRGVPVRFLLTFTFNQ